MRLSYLKRDQNAWIFYITCFFLTYFVLPAAAEAAQVSHTEINHQFYLTTGFENNRTLGDRWELRGIYELKYDTHYRLQTGLSYNGATEYLNGIFIELGYEKINDSQYSLRLKFLGNQYAQYDTAANSIIPYLNWKNTDYYVDIGLNCRFTNFSGDGLWNIFDYGGDVSELILYYRLGWSLPVQDDKYNLTIELKNNHEFYAGNLGAYALFINNSYQWNDRIKIYGNLGYWQTGSIALTATDYKITLHAGLEVKL
ncbi:MAG: hypothetical protein ACM3YE_15230 [Bacteroidota bacterium]